MQFGGRCYLVAVEHMRILSPDEDSILDPGIQSSMDELRRSVEKQEVEYEDLTGQEVDPGDLEETAARGAESSEAGLVGSPLVLRPALSRESWFINDEGDPTCHLKDPWTIPELPPQYDREQFGWRTVYMRDEC